MVTEGAQYNAITMAYHLFAAHEKQVGGSDGLPVGLAGGHARFAMDTRVR
jgi:hypothetical protein